MIPTPALLTLRIPGHWVASRPRTRADVQDAWQSTCPLNCAWEDALADELVAFGRDGRVVLTARGHAVLDAADGRRQAEAAD